MAITRIVDGAQFSARQVWNHLGPFRRMAVDRTGGSDGGGGGLQRMVRHEGRAV